jgi:hypothetical protein
VRDKNQSRKHDIFKRNKGSNAEIFSSIGATFAAWRERVKDFPIYTFYLKQTAPDFSHGKKLFTNENPITTGKY